MIYLFTLISLTNEKYTGDVTSWNVWKECRLSRRVVGGYFPLSLRYFTRSICHSIGRVINVNWSELSRELPERSSLFWPIKWLLAGRDIRDISRWAERRDGRRARL